MTKTIGGQLAPFLSLFFPKSSVQNIEMAILFHIVGRFYNYVFENKLIPKAPGGRGASYEFCPLLTYSTIKKYRDTFQWEFLAVEGSMGGFFPRKKNYGGGGISDRWRA